MKPVAVLCVHPKSIYHSMPGVHAYDFRRDAKSFAGGMPVVGHPPCRGWSAFCRHQAKPEPGELSLGLWVAAQVKRCGGILEQPAHSRLFMAAGLPLPGEHAACGFTLEVCQSWWGYSQLKRTWLFFSGIPRSEIVCPFRFDPEGGKRNWQVMSKQQRSRTLPAFAQWLVETARLAATKTMKHE